MVYNILIGAIILFVFQLVHIHKRKQKHPVNLHLHAFILFTLAVVVYIYSYTFTPTHFPATEDDGSFYNRAGMIFSANLKKGNISFDAPLDYELSNIISNQSGGYSQKDFLQSITDTTAVIYTIFIGLVYTLLGYNPFCIRIFNIIFFQLAFLEFSKIIDSFEINNDTKKMCKRCFLYFPMFMFYSVTMAKEAFVWCFSFALLADVILKRKAYLYLIHASMLLLSRFYCVVLILFPFFVEKISIKRLLNIKILTAFIIFILIFWNNRFFGGYSLKYILFEMYIPFKYNQDGSQYVVYQGIISGLSDILTQPLEIIKAFIRGVTDMFLNPKFWKIVIFPWGDADFIINIFARSTSWFIWFFLMLLFPYIPSILKHPGKYKYFNILFIIVILFAGIHPHTRYTYPFIAMLLVFIAYAKQTIYIPYFYRQNAYLLFIAISCSLVVVDYVFIGKTI